MQKLRFSIDIKASTENIWHVLWDDATFRDWANLIDEGTYLVGEIKEGAEVQWLSASGYGVTSLVEKLVPGEFVTFRHKADTQDLGARARDDEWTGGAESYLLDKHDGTVTLTIEMDAPPEQVETFSERLPKVLERIRELAESE